MEKSWNFVGQPQWEPWATFSLRSVDRTHCRQGPCSIWPTGSVSTFRDPRKAVCSQLTSWQNQTVSMKVRSAAQSDIPALCNISGCGNLHPVCCSAEQNSRSKCSICFWFCVRKSWTKGCIFSQHHTHALLLILGGSLRLVHLANTHASGQSLRVVWFHTSLWKTFSPGNQPHHVWKLSDKIGICRLHWLPRLIVYVLIQQ